MPVLGGFAFANGGIMSAMGSVPLRKYAAGGIANSPQMALYGEGDQNEALCATARRSAHPGGSERLRCALGGGERDQPERHPCGGTEGPAAHPYEMTIRVRVSLLRF